MTEDEKQKRPNGAGSVTKLKHKDKASGEIIESRFYYIFYRVNGRQIRESSQSESKMVAQKLLERRMGEAGLGIRPQQDVKNVSYDDVAKAYLDQQRASGVAFFQKRDGSEYLRGVPNLDAFFKGMHVVNISTDTLRRYIDHRHDEGVADPTVRRELVTLRSMLNQARKEQKIRLVDIPHFPMPKDSKPRTGFIDPDVFERLRATLPKRLRLLVTFLYYTGCRVGAAMQITWTMVSKDCKEIELPGEITKNGEALTLPLIGEGLSEVSTMLKKQFRKDGPVFEVTNLRKDWAAACHKLGLGVKDGWRYRGLTIHDLRRSAVRNLVRAGVREDVAMSISGHKTREVFSRYNITDTADIREALIKVGQYAKEQQRKARHA
jgi:integrase